MPYKFNGHNMEVEGRGTYFPSSSSMCTVSLERRSTSSPWLSPSGRRRGMAATHVRNKSILGFRSPL